jgi:chitinase
MKHLTWALFALLFPAFAAGQCLNKECACCNPPKVVLGYVTSWSEALPDPTLLTHINYAFGHVTDSFDGVRVDNPERLRQVVALKEINPDLKILLSVGGGRSGRFSEMAADANFRRSFAQDCKRVVDEFDIDGIDIDWEYPTSSMLGISSSPDDTNNYTLMMRDIREALGSDKLITLACIAMGDESYIDFPGIDPYVSFVSVMCYDMDMSGKRHQASLYRSPLSADATTHEYILKHLEWGVPANKLVMGVPFYGRGIPELRGSTSYKNIANIKEKGNYSFRWDDEAKVPYIVDENGEMVANYEDPVSVRFKTDYINEHGLRGIMYWDFSSDTEDLIMSRAIFFGLYPDKN